MRPRSLQVLEIIFALSAIPSLCPAEDSSAFARDIRPLVESYCLDCHDGPSARGGIDLAGSETVAALEAAPELWLRVRAQLRDASMPPAGKPQPSSTETVQMVRAIEEILHITSHDPERPAAAIIRRLNRVEYRNTIRDLFGLDIDTEREFPADDIGHGFDNMGEVLALPPLLLESYLNTAERIAARVVLDPEPAAMPTRRTPGREMTKSVGGGPRGDALLLWSTGEATASFSLPRAGLYSLRARVYGQQAGPDPVRIALKVGKRELATFDVPHTQRDPGEFETEAQCEAGNVEFAVAFLNDYYAPDSADPKQRDRNCAILEVALDGPLDPPAISGYQARCIADLNAQLDSTATLAQILRETTRLVYRRPARPDELDRLLTMIASTVPPEATLETRWRLGLVALLTSPSFLFRTELGPERDDAHPQRSRPLDGFEMASRLSYFLWSSTPDRELLATAERDELRTVEQVQTAARRLLADPRSLALAENFATQWLQIRNTDRVRPDPQKFPAVDTPLLNSMRAETVLYFDANLREARDFWELFASDFSFLDERLAQHYGVPGVSGEWFRRVKLPESRPGGVLAHASILTLTSNPTRTSPVKRGKWLLEAILDAPPRPAPPGVGTLATDAPKRADGGIASVREQMLIHRREPSCAQCHTRMDALGFSLENFDAVGRWRLMESGRAIDSTAEFDNGAVLDGFDGLRDYLRAAPAVRRSIAVHLLIYALGRGLTADDEPSLARLVAALELQPTVRDLILELVGLELFRKVRTS
ncbi:MAG: DUF1592 domain-containing protein [Planctomycetota bacterium]